MQIAFGFALNGQQNIVTNYFDGIIHLAGPQFGYITAIREVPGFLLIFLSALFYRVTLQRVTAGALCPARRRLRPLRPLAQLLDGRAVGDPLQHGLSHGLADAERPRVEPDDGGAERGDSRPDVRLQSGRLARRADLHPHHLPLRLALVPPDLHHSRRRRLPRRDSPSSASRICTTARSGPRRQNATRSSSGATTATTTSSP